jgi:hypothetical protein
VDQHPNGRSDQGPEPGPSGTCPSLLPQHLADLRNSGLSDEQIGACGFYSLSDSTQVARLLHWKQPGRLGPCLAIPYRDPNGKATGFVRMKPDLPRTDRRSKKPVRYESPVGLGNRLFIPPGCTRAALADPHTPLLMTEGEKKAAKADQEGFPCLGLTGVYGWQKRRTKTHDAEREGERELIDDLAVISWQGRRVFLVFDSDRDQNVQIQWAELHLAQALAARGAAVKVVRLPAVPAGGDGKPAKVGLDDYLCTHTADDLRQLLAEAADPAEPGPADLAADVKARIARLPETEAAEAALNDRDLIDALLRLEQQDPVAFALAREALRKRGVKVGVLDGVLRAARRARTTSPASPGNPGSAYMIRGGCICQRKNTNQGEVVVPLANFVAQVVESVRVDDGSGEIELFFTVTGKLADGAPLPIATVKAIDFARMDWVLPTWGLRAVVSPGMGAKDHLRAAVQELSRDAVHRVVYKHTGWRELDGGWVYLSGSGAIGAGGLVEGFQVELDDRLRHYHLPPPSSGADLAEAVRASLRLRHLGPSRLIAPVLGAVFRSVLGPVDFSILLVGATGKGKSELSALAQQHFGSAMSRPNLPGNWSSTANALEGLAFLVKDGLFVIDDFKPGGGKSEIDEVHRKAERVLRAQGNLSGRQRCRADGSIRPSRPPRGLILLSGEDSPKGESLQARMLPVVVHAGDINIRDLTPYQKDGAEGLYAQAMAGYLQWLAGQYGSLRGSLAQEHAALRSQAAADGRHPRVPGIVADLAVGWRYFLTFAVEAGALTAAEGDALAGQTWQGLLQAAADQTDELAAREPSRRFLELIAAAIAGGRAHLTARDGHEPDNPLAWGYKARDFHGGTGADTDTAYDPQGTRVGFINGEEVFLEPESSYAVAQRLGEEQGERLPVTQRQLHRRLKDQKLVMSSEGDRATVRRTFLNQERSFLHLSLVSLSCQKPGEPGFPGQTPSNPEENQRSEGPSSPGGPAKPGQDPGSADGVELNRGPKNGEIPGERPPVAPETPIPPVSAGREEASANGKTTGTTLTGDWGRL